MIQDLLAHAPKKAINPNKLATWLAQDLNVLLIGSHGVGKTTMILDTFNTHIGSNWAFFNGATTDPWTSLIGIPTIDHAKGDTLKYIRPEELGDDLEAVYVDELNRAKMATRNALLELIQFKSINGRKFPKLRVVWASVNPPRAEGDEDAFDYDVDNLDPAQVDRFHIIVHIPDVPDKAFFSSKYGIPGINLVDWWHTQSDIGRKLITPRRLEYIAQLNQKGMDLSDALPVCANVRELKLIIDKDKTEVEFEKAFKDGNIETLQKLNKQPRWAKETLERVTAILKSNTAKGVDLASKLGIMQDLLNEKNCQTMLEYAITSQNLGILKELKQYFSKTENKEAKQTVSRFLQALENLKSMQVIKLNPNLSGEQYLGRINAAINACRHQTYDRRKAILELSEVPIKLPKNILTKLDELATTWSKKVQGFSMRNLGSSTRELTPLNPDQEILIMRDLIINYLLFDTDSHTKFWYKKLNDNGGLLKAEIKPAETVSPQEILIDEPY